MGGLRYHGMSPIISKLYYDRYMEATSAEQTEVFKSAVMFGLTGTGYFDMSAYSSYIDNSMDEYIPSDDELEKYFKNLPKV